MTDCPNNQFSSLAIYLESLQNSFSYLGSYGMVPMGRDLVALILGHQRFAHVMEEGSPEEIGITVIGTGLNSQLGMLGHIALGVILSRLRSTSKLGKLRDGLNDSVPPARITSSQQFRVKHAGT